MNSRRNKNLPSDPASRVVAMSLDAIGYLDSPSACCVPDGLDCPDRVAVGSGRRLD